MVEVLKIFSPYVNGISAAVETQLCVSTRVVGREYFDKGSYVKDLTVLPFDPSINAGETRMTGYKSGAN